MSKNCSSQTRRGDNADKGDDSDWGSEFGDEDDNLDDDFEVEADQTGQLSVVEMVHRSSILLPPHNLVLVSTPTPIHSSIHNSSHVDPPRIRPCISLSLVNDIIGGSTFGAKRMEGWTSRCPVE